MKLFRLLPLLMAGLLGLHSCSKDNSIEPEKPAEEQASKDVVSVFHKTDQYYQPYVYRYDSTARKWTNRIASHFSTVPASDPTYIGFTNPNVVDSGVNLFGMVTLYATQIGTNNIKEAKINAEKVLQFFPDAVGATKGKVKVLNQDVTISRKDGAPFKIGISGEGTYDTQTKVMDLVVHFNETTIGGAAKVSRTYKISVDALSLN
ncbi:hypothetical protein BWI93_23255 [Siphonobacter sp. BAB-5385]|uniref:hypothetical protein n=1 Tax=Siphonobacter sp. BAB-5385 TaxID=1864822 RepID=UPI000B9E5F3D|nr:hypothetical protein [Siphonobacter sp. BAB-5385]OZI05820.1 hypothetical protein BWI93_23255 [Siphonobacter sp. BAB-5385]